MRGRTGKGYLNSFSCIQIFRPDANQPALLELPTLSDEQPTVVFKDLPENRESPKETQRQGGEGRWETITVNRSYFCLPERKDVAAQRLVPPMDGAEGNYSVLSVCQPSKVVVFKRCYLLFWGILPKIYKKKL